MLNRENTNNSNVQIQLDNGLNVQFKTEISENEKLFNFDDTLGYNFF